MKYVIKVWDRIAKKTDNTRLELDVHIRQLKTGIIY